MRSCHALLPDVFTKLSILKHKNVAFRFIPQAPYEQVAPPAVSPAPEVITRDLSRRHGRRTGNLDIGHI